MQIAKSADDFMCDVPGGNKTPYRKDYSTWCDIKRNCFQEHRVATRGKREVVLPWAKFSVFQKWFHEHYKPDYCLTTAMVNPDDYLYGPDTCAFVPKWLQSILTITNSANGYVWNNTTKAYVATLNMYGKNVQVGLCQLEESARVAYLNARASYLNLIANNAYDQDIIDEETYSHLKNKVRCIKQQVHDIKSEHKDLGRRDLEAYKASCKLVRGVGINDLMHEMKTQTLKSYTTWTQLLKRAYDKDFKAKNKTYEDCWVDKAWLTFSGFKKWYDDNYIEGYELDKDLLVCGNKKYGPDTCCFIPPWLNKLIMVANMSPKNKCIIVRDSSYCISMGMFGKNYYASCKTLEQAQRLYVHVKRKHYRTIANEAYDQGLINEEAYAALRKRITTLIKPT